MPTLEDEIVNEAARTFRSFGRGLKAGGGDFNPLVRWMKNDPPSFAAGVDIREVVRFVLERAEAKPGKRKEK